MRYKMKKKRILLLLLEIFGLLAIGGIVAYFTSGDTADNLITIGSNEIEIVEEFDPPDELTPNSTFHKDVKFENTGESPCYIRVAVKFTDMDIGKYCSMDYNPKWVEGTDGYWYYPDLVNPGEQTESLFTTVTIGDVPVETITGFDIIVYGESVQCLGDVSGTYEETWATYQKNKEGGQ